MAKALTLTSAAFLMVLARVAFGATSAESQLLKLEQIWMRAAQHRDIRALNRILSDDYIDINCRGILRNKTDTLRVQNVQMKKNYTQKLHKEKIRIYGNTSIVTGCGILATASNSYFWRFTDVFVEKNGVWRVVSSQETAASRYTSPS